MPEFIASPERTAPPSRAEVLSRAAALRRKLGRPLRMEIEGALSDEDLAEAVLARAEDNRRIPIAEVLAEFRRESASAE